MEEHGDRAVCVRAANQSAMNLVFGTIDTNPVHETQLRYSGGTVLRKPGYERVLGNVLKQCDTKRAELFAFFDGWRGMKLDEKQTICRLRQEGSRRGFVCEGRVAKLNRFFSVQGPGCGERSQQQRQTANATQE